MTTVSTMITRALRTLGVLQSGESPSAEESSDALVAFNDMLNFWRTQGVDLEFYEFTAISDTIPYPEDHMAAFRYNLAVWLSPEYGVSPSDVIGALALSTFEALHVQYRGNEEMVIDPMLSRGANGRIPRTRSFTQ